MSYDELQKKAEEEEQAEEEALRVIYLSKNLVDLFFNIKLLGQTNLIEGGHCHPGLPAALEILDLKSHVPKTTKERRRHVP